MSRAHHVSSLPCVDYSWCARLAAGLLAPGPAASAIAGGRYAIGDSVMLGARDELRARGFVVDTEKSRQFADAVTIVRHKAASGVLRRKV